MLNTYRHGDLSAQLKDGVKCGERTGYQVQTMETLASPVLLLNAEVDEELSPDPDLAVLAQQVNAFFKPKAQAALDKKRAQLTASGDAEVAARTELTCLLTDRGLQLGWSLALPRKEIAPAPKKSLLRRVLGPLYPGRRYWEMPATTAGLPGRTYTVWWPWVFWAAVLLAGAAATYWLGSAADSSEAPLAAGKGL